MGCGDSATSQSENTNSVYDNDMQESLKTEDNSNNSYSEESSVSSDKIDNGNTTEIYSEVEIDFSEFE